MNKLWCPRVISDDGSAQEGRVHGAGVTKDVTSHTARWHKGIVREPRNLLTDDLACTSAAR